MVALCFGSQWFSRCDGFEVFSILVGKLSIFGVRDDGRLVMRDPLENLDGTVIRSGLVPVVAIMLGSTAFDSVTSSALWVELSYKSSLSPSMLATVALINSILAVGIAFALVSWLAGLLGRHRGGMAGNSRTPSCRSRSATGSPITSRCCVGWETLINASDPLVNGSDLLGIADSKVDYGILSTPPSRHFKSARSSSVTCSACSPRTTGRSDRSRRRLRCGVNFR
jgi:hypothetical protein